MRYRFSLSLELDMSKHISKNKHFLSLLLNTSDDQAIALLYTVTPEQLLLISEIAHNLLELPLNKKAAHLLKQKKRFFENIAHKKLAQAQKKRLLHRHSEHLLATLLAVKGQLEQLV